MVSVKPQTAASEKIRKATNQAKYDANKHTETEAKRLLASQLFPDIYLEWEYVFTPTRKWRFDAAISVRMIGIEIEGRGRHTEVYRRKKADGTREARTPFEKDCEKYNTAAILGWRVLRFTYAMIKSGEAAETIRRALDSSSYLG